MRGKESVARLMEDAGIPQDALLSCARVLLIGRNAATIEGQRGVVELTCGRIRLRTDSGILCILGTELLLRELTPDRAVVAGTQIQAVSFE